MDWITLSAGFGLGWAAGYIACVLLQVLPIQKQLVRMRKQGFVPQFELEQDKENDPSRDIPEY